MVKIGFIGTGNIASAILKSILNNGITDNFGIICSNRNEEKLEKIKKEYEVLTTKDNNEAVKNSSIIFITVKPQDIVQVLHEIKDSITNEKIIVSVAAGIKISKIESIIGKKKIVRLMPNAPCMVGEMAAAFTANSALKENEISTLQIIFETSGRSFQVDESLMDSVTGLSGSGPAFVARLIDAFKKAGIENGLSEKISYALAIQTFIGTAKMLEKNKMSPDELVKIVSSPNGTTVAGRSILENSDVEKIISETISASVKRSRELGK